MAYVVNMHIQDIVLMELESKKKKKEKIRSLIFKCLKVFTKM